MRGVLRYNKKERSLPVPFSLFFYPHDARRTEGAALLVFLFRGIRFPALQQLPRGPLPVRKRRGNGRRDHDRAPRREGNRPPHFAQHQTEQHARQRFQTQQDRRQRGRDAALRKCLHEVGIRRTQRAEIEHGGQADAPLDGGKRLPFESERPAKPQKPHRQHLHGVEVEHVYSVREFIHQNDLYGKESRAQHSESVAAVEISARAFEVEQEKHSHEKDDGVEKRPPLKFFAEYAIDDGNDDDVTARQHPALRRIRIEQSHRLKEKSKKIQRAHQRARGDFLFRKARVLFGFEKAGAEDEEKERGQKESARQHGENAHAARQGVVRYDNAVSPDERHRQKQRKAQHFHALSRVF